MSNVIEIDVETPYLRPNYNFIADCMEKEGTVVLLHDQVDATNLGRNITRRGYSFGMTKVDKDTWKVEIREKKKKAKRGMQDDLSNVSQEYIDKADLLEKGKKITLVNRGQVIYFLGLYKKLKPKDKRKIKFEKRAEDHLMWMVEEK